MAIVSIALHIIQISSSGFALPPFRNIFFHTPIAPEFANGVYDSLLKSQKGASDIGISRVETSTHQQTKHSSCTFGRPFETIQRIAQTSVLDLAFSIPMNANDMGG